MTDATPQRIFLGSCLLDNTLIEYAVEAGLVAACFEKPEHRELWTFILSTRCAGNKVDSTHVVLGMGNACPRLELFACEESAPTSAVGKKALKSILEAHSRATLRHALNDTLSSIDDAEPYDAITQKVEALPSLLRQGEPEEHSIGDIVADALNWATNEIAGNASDDALVYTGLPHFDDRASPIRPHEYVIIGARTSHGKSSMANQIAGHNLNRGLRVAVFTLETSARAVVLQIAAQRAGVNLRLLHHEATERQARFKQEIEKIAKQPMLIFDRDLTLERIESRCRLLAASFKPNLVIIDYLGLIKVKAQGAYERMSILSKAMIPIKKSLGECALIVAAQLNRGNEKEDRAPTRTDFRDAGSIEEDAHRIIALHRPREDRSGMEQGLDRTIYDMEIFQLKLRDGPLAHGYMKFNAAHTRFFEE